MPAIYIDVGHGGSDPGAVRSGSICEKDLNLKVALYLNGILKGHGFETKLSRGDDVFVPIDASAKKANIWGADFVVGIHHNAGGGDGAEIIISSFKPGQQQAAMILDQFQGIGQNLRSKPFVKRLNSAGNDDYYGIIRSTDAPAIITEYAFIDSADFAAVDTEDELYAEAAAIAHGLCNYFGVAWETTQVTQLTDINDIVWELANQGVLANKDLWLKKLYEDEDAYWLARKAVNKLTGRG